MEYYKNRICVTVEDLTRSDDGEAVMTMAHYKYCSKRSLIRKMREGKGLGCYALIEYNSLPPRYRARFEDKYGKPEAVLKEKPLTEEIAIDANAREFYRAHVLPDGSHMTDEQIDEYTMNASVLNELIRLLNNRRSTRRAHGGKAADFWDSILLTCEKFREYPGHTLAPGKSQLQTKMNAYKKNGYAAIISGKLGNVNSLKITEEAGNQIIALKRSRVPVYNNEQIFREFNRIAEERGWKTLRSVKSLVQFLHRPEVEPRWWDAVYGELSAKNRYSRKHKTEMPTMRDSLWYSDGTKINLFYKAFDSDGKLVVRTTMVYEVMDAYSETLLGFHISDTENFDSQYHAFRMALETYRHRPYEIVNDNQGGHKKLTAIGFLDRIKGKVSRRTEAYNPPSKTIESAFGRFQAQILHKDWRFTGQNITAKSDASRANIEFVEANKEFLYTLPELKEAYAKARQEWNMSAHPHTTRPRLQMYLSSQNAEAKEVTDLDMMELFWLQTAKPVEFTPNGITITVNKKKYTYEVFDAEGLPDLAFRREHTYRKFVVMYDPLDMTHVRLFTQEKTGLRYIADAYPYAVFARNIQEQKPGDMEFIRTMDRLGKEERIRRQVEAAELENAHGVAPEQHGLNRPKIKGVSAKTVEKVMAAMAKPEAPREEIVDIGLVHKYNSNQTPAVGGSRYDKI